MRPPQATRKRRLVALAALGSLLLGGLIAGNGLVSCTTSAAVPTPPATRPVTAPEAARLAGVRYADHQTAHAGISVTIGTGANAVHLTGWVDWLQPLVYLNSVGQRPGPADGLLQAVPGVVAVHPGRYRPAASAAPVDPFPAPPVPAPPTGWQVRPITPSSAIDTMITLLFALSSETADDAGQIAAIGTRFVDTDEIGGVPVDVLDGAAIPPPAAAPGVATPTPSPTGPAFAAQGGQVRYWVDAQSHLLRAEALVDPTTSLRIDFDRADPTDPSAIELLGGAIDHPAHPTTAQLTALSQMRAHDYLAGGGIVTLAVPVGPTELISAVGWLDWRDRALYVTVRNNIPGGADQTLRADIDGVTVRGSLTAGGGADSAAGAASPSPSPGTVPPRPALAAPPLHPPATGWHRGTWASREDAYGETDIDALLNEVLALAAPVVDAPAALKVAATRLRDDTVDGVPVTVYEIRKPSEATVPPGEGRLRYWVDADGQLRRLELRTRNGAYGYLTITPAAVPPLPNPVPVTHHN